MLEFKNVTFQYEGDEAPMMTDLSFSVEEGEMIAIVGTMCERHEELADLKKVIRDLMRMLKGE